MRLNAFIFALISLPLFGVDEPIEKVFFSCSITNGQPTHLIHFEMSPASKETRCSALAVDGLGGAVGQGHTYNSNWNCEETEISKWKQGREVLIKMQVEKAKGIGEEAQRFDTLLLLLDTETYKGGGFATKLNDRREALTCRREASGPPRIDSLNP